MSTLCVIDMQPKFEAAKCRSTTAQVVDQINLAKKQRDNIVLVSYNGFGPIDENVWNAAKEYRHKIHIFKDASDGSEQIVDACNDMGYNTDRFVVCGIETDCCVRHTTEGLLWRLPQCKIEIPVKACNTWRTNQLEALDWASYHEGKQLELVGLY